MKIEKAQLLEEIKKSGGNMSEIARKFGMSRQAIAKRIKTSEALQAAMHQAVESLTDIAEYELKKHIEKGNLKALVFWLATKGRDRGYAKTLNVETNQPTGVLHFHFPDDGRDKPDPNNPIEPEPVECIGSDETPPMQPLDESDNDSEADDNG